MALLRQRLNIIRSEFGEQLIKGRDWYRPYVVSAMIFHENDYRREIGLPALTPDSMLPLEHSTFMNFVAQGERNPLFAWPTSASTLNAFDRLQFI
jgi:hypothetical protein